MAAKPEMTNTVDAAETAPSRRPLMARLVEINRTRRPEHDVALRLLIMAAVMISVLAVLAAGAAPAIEALAVVVLLPVGFAWSYRQRTSSNLTSKAVISVMAMIVLWRFFDDVLGLGNVDDARLPLTIMFLEIQVLHAFDLPQRRDLMFTLSSSLALLALALAAGPAAWVLVLVVAYAGLLGAALHRYQRSVDDEWLAEGSSRQAVVAVPVTVSTRVVRLGLFGSALVVVAVLLFASVPLRADASLGGLPISFGSSGPRAMDGSGRVGGDLPFDESDGAGSQEFDPAEYFGFAERVDPRSVGQLSDTPILQVRTNRPRPLRGVVFDTYQDGIWGRSEDEPAPQQGLPVQLQSTRSSLSVTTRVTQTVEVLQPTPNLIFAANDPVEVWTAAQSVTPWSDGTLTTGIDMQVGTIYSVVSAVDVTPRPQLRSQAFDYSNADGVALSRWTTLPNSVPDRVHELATELADRAIAPTPYAIAESIQAYIGREISYDLGGPVTPADADPADHLLFESQVGWCEPIATSMVVLLRSVGIPSRFVTGFQPGDRNVLSGQYTVRASNAHAWVEVFVPNHGWVAFDPTGVTTQSLDPEGEGSAILLASFASWLVERLPRDPAVWAGLVLLAGACGTLVVQVRRMSRVRALRRAGPWAQLLDRLRIEGVTAPPSDTPAEVVERATRALPHLDADAMSELAGFEQTRRYTTTDPDPTGATRALERL